MAFVISIQKRGRSSSLGGRGKPLLAALLIPRANRIPANHSSQSLSKSSEFDLGWQRWFIRQDFWNRVSTIAAIGTIAVFGASAQAADSVPPERIWTGLSMSVGGGVTFMSPHISSSDSRTDKVGTCRSELIEAQNFFVPLDRFFDAPCDPTRSITPTLDLTESAASDNTDPSGTGGFFTVQGAYDYQFAPRWVAGAFLDSDWSDIRAQARQTQTSSQTILNYFLQGEDATVKTRRTDDFVENTTTDTLVRTDWSVSVGGRLGWLATRRALLYFLAGYTYASLDEARVNVSIADPVTGSVSSSDTSKQMSLLVRLPDALNGFSVGGGTEIKLGGPWAAKLEYRWTHLYGGSESRSIKSFESIPTIGLCQQGEPLECFAPLEYRDLNSHALADYNLDMQTVRGELVYYFWSNR